MIGRLSRLCLLFLCMSLFAAACSGDRAVVAKQTAVPTVRGDLPKIKSVELDRAELPRYESLEMTLDVDAKYSNPYDAREVMLEGVFTSPSGQSMTVPGFWDGKDSWRIRFTPSLEGAWIYSIIVTDSRGQSLPMDGEFVVTPSDLHGWIIPGNTFDPAYSGHYLVHHNGTPFYGVGHCDALNILIDGFGVEEGVGLFDNMKAAHENYVVWWPFYSNPIMAGGYDNYSLGNLEVIDAVVKDAQKEGIYLVFTIWDHPNLRDNTHSWDDGKWAQNGFSKLSDINSFFVSEEAWAWQENYYRYLIARWGYSPAIGMWQTVSEIDGTNAYDQTDPWHKRVNDYFVANDPYRHPTTASGSGEWDWPAGHLVMDAPQVQLYNWDIGAVGAAKISSGWTRRMWERTERPNWIGEFGVKSGRQYPELFHHAIWAALASGSSMTPAEWNSGGSFGRMTPEMNADIGRLAFFVTDLPLAKWDPSRLGITSSDPQVRGWGAAGNDGGLFWVQDFALEGRAIDEVRASTMIRSGVEITVTGMAEGSYSIQPYDTWLGTYPGSFDIECKANEPCEIPLPDFKSDMAFKIMRK